MYKRNQVEGAIARVTGKTSGQGSDLPASDLSIRLKRLTETDRSMTVSKRSMHPVLRTFAFFDDAQPGRGAEISYSAYCAFALYLGVRLMEAGLPQRETVAFLRRIRRDLEFEHDRILRTDPNRVADKRAVNAVEAALRHGKLVMTIDKMVFVVVPAGDPWPISAETQEGDLVSASICRGAEKLNRTLEHYCRISGPPVICMELINPSHQLKYWLEKIDPIKRGRK